MIQRIQTVYLALAVLLLVLCCCMPLAQFEPHGMGLPSVLYSLVLLDADHSVKSYFPVSLLLDTCIIELVGIAAIVSYKNRRRQMKLCSFAAFFLLIWIFNYGVFARLLMPDAIFRPRMAACLPVVALVLVLMARRAIKKDDDLVRSADRIR